MTHSNQFNMSKLFRTQLKNRFGRTIQIKESCSVKRKKRKNSTIQVQWLPLKKQRLLIFATSPLNLRVNRKDLKFLTKRLIGNLIAVVSASKRCQIKLSSVINPNLCTNPKFKYKPLFNGTRKLRLAKSLIIRLTIARFILTFNLNLQSEFFKRVIKSC